MTGGSIGGTDLSSTEQLVKDGGGSWTIKENSLPARMSGLGTISFNDQIFTTGIKSKHFEQNIIHSFYFQEDMIQIPVLSQIR